MNGSSQAPTVRIIEFANANVVRKSLNKRWCRRDGDFLEWRT